jgi:uncharacterized protein (TIGR02391 family)
MEEISPDLQASVTREVWQRRAKEGAWPDAYDILDFIGEYGLSLEQIERIRGLEVEKSPNNTNRPERVRLNWRALARVPEGSALFGPLPRLVYEAAARVRCFPPFIGNSHQDNLVIPFDHMVRAWKSNEQALLAAELLRNGGPGGVSFTPQPNGAYTILSHVQALRFRRARTFEQICEMSETWKKLDPAPRSEHIRLLQAVFDFARSNLAWPLGLPFAGRYHWIGYVPDLIEELAPKYVTSLFGYFDTDHLKLRLWSLSLLDEDGSWRAAALKFITGLARVWKATRKQRVEQFTLQQVAGEADLTLRQAAFVAMLCEEEKWQSGLDKRGEPSNWKVGARDEIWKYKDCATWDEFVVARKGPDEYRYDQFGDSGPVLPVRSAFSAVDADLDGDATEPSARQRLLLLPDIHPRLQEKVGSAIEKGLLRAAVHDAMIALDNEVARKTGSKLHGSGLMTTTFSKKSPLLRLSDEEEEQEGFMYLYLGAMKALRNQYSHDVDAKPESNAEAAEWLYFASALFRLLDRFPEPPQSANH